MSLTWVVIGLLLVLVVVALAGAALLIWALDLREALKHAVAERDLARTDRDDAELATGEARAELNGQLVENNRLLDEVHALEAVIQAFFPDSISKDFS